MIRIVNAIEGRTGHRTGHQTQLTLQGPDSTLDLAGRYLLPGLIESHCHILSTGLDLNRLNLGACCTPEATLEAVRDRAHEGEGWLLAVHYDQNRWTESHQGRHLTRADLDAITNRPVLLRHVNGHAGVANSAALQAAGLGETEPDPPGGSFGRGPDGVLTGVLFETALNRVYAAAPSPTLEEMVEAILAAGRSMHAYGIATAHDMLTGAIDLATELWAYQIAAARGNPIDVRLYVAWSRVLGDKADPTEAIEPLRTGTRRLRLAGLKLFADGAIGSATAAIYGAYGEGGENAEGTSGQLIYSPEVLNERVRIAHDAGWQLSTHAIGDYAVDLVMDAYEATGDPKRHRIEHAMLLSDRQIERLANLGSPVSMQPEFLVRFGHTYRAQLGEARAAKLNRAKSLRNAGVKLALSSDRPIVSGDPWLGIAAATNRPQGFDQAENLSPEEAVEGYLEFGVQISGEGLDQDPKRLIVLDQDPLTPTQSPSVEWLPDVVAAHYSRPQ